MTLPLMQAFGRLIRTMTDRGVVAIMDPRIVGKGYGKKVSRSIPAPLTIDLAAVKRFLEAL
jgi:ATP-dependent DNA helicase DinG